MRPTYPGIEQSQVVIDLSDRPNGRSGVARRGLLIDGDGRRQAFDEINIRLVHLSEELTGIGRKRLDIAALALGVDRVECQRGLSRTREAGEDDELLSRQRHRDILEIVFPRSSNRDDVGHSRRLAEAA